MTGARKKALRPYVPDLVAVLHKTNNYRALGTHLRWLRDKDVLRDLDEQRWLQTEVIHTHAADLAYYRSITPKQEEP